MVRLEDMHQGLERRTRRSSLLYRHLQRFDKPVFMKNWLLMAKRESPRHYPI